MCGTGVTAGRLSAKLSVGEFGLRLWFFRHSRGLTQDQIAQQLGVGLRTYQRYETGELQPKVDFVYRYAQVMGISADYLFSVNRVGNAIALRKLSQTDHELFDGFFLPSQKELTEWRDTTKQAYLDLALSQLNGSPESSNACLFISNLAGVAFSPGNMAATGRPEFVSYGDAALQEVMADVWGNVLTGRYESFAIRYQIEKQGELLDMVSWNWVVSRDAERSCFFGSEIELNQRPELNYLVEKLFEDNKELVP